MYPCSFSPWSIDAVYSSTPGALFPAQRYLLAQLPAPELDAAAARFFQQVDGRDNGTTVASIGSTISAIRSSMLETSFGSTVPAPAFLHYGTYRRR